MTFKRIAIVINAYLWSNEQLAELKLPTKHFHVLKGIKCITENVNLPREILGFNLCNVMKMTCLAQLNCERTLS